MKTADVMTQARFWNNVKVISQSNSNQCWEWQGAIMPNGYGMASVGCGKTELAHRFVAGLTQDITDKTVLHNCDNPCCVRPDHLTVGSQQDNIDDMIAKGRKNTKLNIRAVRDIRTRQQSRVEYALKYGVSLYTVGEIQRGKTWIWV